jgi:hypothetical protein
MEPQDDGRAARRGSARARSLMAAASLLGLSLGVGVAHAAETGAPAADASDQIKHKGAADEASRTSGHYIKVQADQIKQDSSQIKGESTPADASAHYEKWRADRAVSDQIKGEGPAADRTSHHIKMDASQMKMDSSQMKGESTDAASHQVKLKGQ